MPQPRAGDLINIHTHDSVRTDGVFAVENLMLHEGRDPDDSADAYSVGIHPWFLNKADFEEQLARLSVMAADARIVAIGEAGYDKRKGPDLSLQREAFEAQAKFADEFGKPLMIHCVKGWDELWESRRRLKPNMPWIIHGFNGSVEQARQLIAGDMHLSMWVKSVLNGALLPVIAEIPIDRIFLETDGFDVDIGKVYELAAPAAGMSVGELTGKLYQNYMSLYK